MSNAKKHAEQVLLIDGTPAEKNFYDRIKDRITARDRDIIRGPQYTSEQLCGKRFWKDHGRQKLAGKCIYHMVMTGSLPLVLAQTAHEYPRKYERI